MEEASTLSTQDKRRGFFGLYTGRIIMTISGGLLGIFLPIFLYELFDGNVQMVVLYYAIGALAYMVLLPLGVQFLNSFGFRKSLIVATLSAALMYSAYYFTDAQTATYLIPLSLVALVLFRLFFWIPYHVDFAIFTHTKNRGAQVGLLLATLTLLGVVGPIVAGYIITLFGMTMLFAISIVVFLLSVIPFSVVPRTNEKFSWSYLRSWRELFSKKNRPMVLACVAAGADDTLGVVVWPIFIFLLLNGDYFKVGAISSITTGVIVLAQLFIGRHMDRVGNKHSVLKIGSALYALGWIAKIFVATAFQIFIAGLYHKFAKVFTDTSFDTIFYELASDQGHYIDEFTLLSELGVQIGKIIALVSVSLLTIWVGIQWAFIVGVLAAFYLNALSGATRGRVGLAG